MAEWPSRCGVGSTDVRRLREYAWPGNVRELQHLTERAAIISTGRRLVLELTATAGAEEGGADLGPI